MVEIRSGIFGTKEKRSPATCSKIEGNGEHCVKQNYPEKDNYHMFSFIGRNLKNLKVVLGLPGTGENAMAWQ